MIKTVIGEDIYFAVEGGFFPPSSINWVEFPEKYPEQLLISLYGKDRPILLSKEDSSYILPYLIAHSYVNQERETEAELEEEKTDAI